VAGILDAASPLVPRDQGTLQAHSKAPFRVAFGGFVRARATERFAQQNADISSEFLPEPDRVAGVAHRGVPSATAMERVMDWYRIEGNWNQIKGRLKQTWGEFIDNEFEIIEGRRDQFVGRVQEEYGLACDRARRSVVRKLPH
jgi:uncharacterized protein YjbJ (UPF0337 family)